jgi:hypothetical protein
MPTHDIIPLGAIEEKFLLSDTKWVIGRKSDPNKKNFTNVFSFRECDWFMIHRGPGVSLIDLIEPKNRRAYIISVSNKEIWQKEYNQIEEWRHFLDKTYASQIEYIESNYHTIDSSANEVLKQLEGKRYKIKII